MGIYIHIPFCAKKCYYCDFFMSLSLQYKEEYLQTLIKELGLRKNYLQNKPVETIYLGGGTPSLLSEKELNEIFEQIYKTYNVSEKVEITAEANPDDLSNSYLKELKKTPINRLSIGIQSFFDDDLQMMNRRHSAEQSMFVVKKAQDNGFSNISGDLIYGLPGMSSKKWKKNLNSFFELKIPHLSAYHLTYEPNTVFIKRLKTGKIKEISEEESIIQFKILQKEAKKNNFFQYETSNFGKEGFFSKHNTAYWQQKHYLGIGASAHSYNGNSRQFNIKNIKEYIKRTGEDNNYFKKEILSEKDKYNDYIITRLRTMWGVDINFVKKKICENYAEFLVEKAQKHIEKGNLTEKKNILYVTEQGKFIEDFIIEDLFYL
ncbi:MAG: radical SAM family heme chaperone HemW [Chlorobi bacterium]|nr:radical SAM family heme chaperone HemW [Chlorobiota bacterium]